MRDVLNHLMIISDILVIVNYKNSALFYVKL